MCTIDELSAQINKLNKNFTKMFKRLDLLESNMTTLNNAVNDLQNDKSANLFRRKRDEEAFISMMIDLQRSIKDVVFKMASLENSIETIQSERTE